MDPDTQLGPLTTQKRLNEIEALVEKTKKETDITTRSNIMMKIADVLEKNLNLLATAECLDNGKPIRECMAADLPLVIDHWRYFAGVIRAEEGSVAEISNSEYSYHIPEPLGVVGQIIPWNVPLLMAT